MKQEKVGVPFLACSILEVKGCAEASGWGLG